MTDRLKQGWELIRQKQFAEAERIFTGALSNLFTRQEALEALAEIEQARRNLDLKLKYLDELVVLSPDNFNARLMRAHLHGKRGHVELYRHELDRIMQALTKTPFQPNPVYKKMLKGIQFAYSGSERVQRLVELLERAKKAIEEYPKSSARLIVFSAELYFALGDLGKLANEVGKIPKQSLPLPGLKSLQEVAEKVNNPKYPDFNAPKIFGIGLSRTATSSLNNALGILGFHAIHWLNPHTRTVISENDFVLFDAFTDIPVSYQFEKLYYTFPNSQFILTSRSLASWVKSIATHYQNNRKIFEPSELCKADKAGRFSGAVRPIEWNLYGQYHSWEEAYGQFVKRVSHFFSDKPTSRFLELNICAGEGWKKLCPFLDKPIPDLPFPNANKGPVHISLKNL